MPRSSWLVMVGQTSKEIDMTYETNPRDYALELVEDGVISPTAMLLAALKYMSSDDVADMLDMIGMSPRYFQENDGQPDEAQEWADFDPDC